MLEASKIVEVLPLVTTRDIPQAPPGVAGLFNYRGAPVPLLDLAELAVGAPSRAWFSTRIVLVRDGDQLLGLLAEGATETIRLEPSDFVDSPIDVPDARYLGAVVIDSRGLIQRIELEKLLPAELRESLFIPSRGVMDVAAS